MSKKQVLVFVPFAALLCLLLASGASAAVANSPRVVILEFHGMKQGILAQGLDGLPNFREMILGPRNDQAYVYVPKVLTTIPAASQPAVTSMYTGLHPERTGVVSTIWFDRQNAETRTLISYWQGRINRILEARGIKSLFDYAAEAGKQSMTSMLMLTKGADWSVRSGAFFWGNASLFGVFRNNRLIPDGRYVDERTMLGFLTGHIFSYNKSLTGISRNRHCVPDLMAVQLLGIDLFSHYPESSLESRRASMDEVQTHYARTVLDPLMGRLIETLKSLGCYEDTIFVLISEHGFTRVSNRIRDDVVDRSLEKAFKLPGWARSYKKAEAVIMPGACTKEVYLKNRQTLDWMDPPRLLADVKPAVDQLLGSPELVESVDTLLIRQYPGERYEGLEESDRWWVFDWRTYRAGSKDNPSFLQNLGPLAALSEEYELGEYVVNGVRRQYTRETAPDIQMVNKKGYYFLDDFDKRAHHGSFYRDDLTVSFWVAGPGLARIIPGRHSIDRIGSTLDLVPMVTSLLGVPVPVTLDGENPLAGSRKSEEGRQQP